MIFLLYLKIIILSFCLAIALRVAETSKICLFFIFISKIIVFIAKINTNFYSHKINISELYKILETVALAQFRRLTSRKFLFGIIRENKISAYACQQRFQTNRITKGSFISIVCFNALLYIYLFLDENKLFD